MIEVIDSAGVKSVRAAHAIREGAFIVGVGGWESSLGRSVHSIQIAFDSHAIFPLVRFINHSCEPNCAVKLDSDLITANVFALQDIADGEELTLDYAVFEGSIENFPPSCLCGSASCRGTITGFKDLPQSVKIRHRDFVPDYLRFTTPP